MLCCTLRVWMHRSLTALTGVAALALVCGLCACAEGSRHIQPILPVGEDELGIAIDCQPAEAEVRIDGVLRGSCGWLASPKAGRIVLSAGQHELEVTAIGYRSFHSSFSGRGIQQSLTVRLTRSAGQGLP